MNLLDAIGGELSLRGDFPAIVANSLGDIQCGKDRGTQDPDTVLGEVTARADPIQNEISFVSRPPVDTGGKRTCDRIRNQLWRKALRNLQAWARNVQGRIGWVRGRLVHPL